MRDFNNTYTTFQVHVLSGRTNLMEKPTGNLDWQSTRRRKRPLWGHLLSLATVLTRTYLILKPLFMLKHPKKTFIVSLESFPARSIIANVKSPWVISIYLFWNIVIWRINSNIDVTQFARAETKILIQLTSWHMRAIFSRQITSVQTSVKFCNLLFENL